MPGTVYPGPDTETTTNGGPLILICRRPGAWSGQRPRAGCRVWFDRERGNPQAPRTSGLRRGGFFDMRVCVPITDDGQVDPRWGRADRVAVADVADKEIRDWQEFTVAWGTLHDQGTEGAHHARVARFLRDNQVTRSLFAMWVPACSACS